MNTTATRAPFDRPDLFRNVTDNGRNKLYEVQPALTARQRAEALALVRTRDPYLAGWLDDSIIIVRSLD